MTDNAKIFKRCYDTSDADKVMFEWQQENSKYALCPLHLPNPDKNLNCAEPWHDYGNYESVGINESDELFTLWDCVAREWVVFNKTQNKTYSVKEEGEWWNHSENCDTPGRTAFDKEVNISSDAKISIDEFFGPKKAEIFAEFKEYVKNKAFDNMKKAEDNLRNANAHLEDLRINHKRAFRQIENAEKDVARYTRNYDAAKTYYEGL